jgi:hypothetical protein
VADFLENIIPPAKSNRYCVFSWLRDAVSSVPDDAGAIKLAVSALATGWTGRVDYRQDFIHKGLEMYTAAAQKLGRGIGESRPPHILAVTALFTMYELFEFGSQDNNGWQYHILGASASVEASDEVELSACPYVHVFDFFRPIFVSLFPSFLTYACTVFAV